MEPEAKTQRYGAFFPTGNVDAKVVVQYTTLRPVAQCLALTKEATVTLLEQIQQQLQHLPPEKQHEVLDFVTSLRQRLAPTKRIKQRSLSEHPAFGSWRGRRIDALTYQQDLRAEWDARP